MRLLGMLVYIAFRFEWVYGAAAVIAVFHDVLITLGFFSLFHYEISLTVIAALLTLVGYSMNDTIVIFDRVRENLRLMRRESFAEIVNKSINQTLSRTILTSGLTFLTVLVLYLMGGEVLRAFAFAMVVGVVVGTYSSFGIAAPIVVVWNKYRGQGAAITRRIRSRKARGGSRKEVVVMFDDLVVSSANPKRTNKPWTMIVSTIDPGRNPGRADPDSPDLYRSSAQGNAHHFPGGACATSASTAACCGDSARGEAGGALDSQWADDGADRHPQESGDD